MASAKNPAVLVVDDNPQARAAVVAMLEALGLTAYDAYRGEDALKLLVGHPEITVLFADVRMPWMSGPELARKARLVRPDLRVVLTSGYDYEGADADIFLPKPVRLNQLAAIFHPDRQNH